MSKRKKENQKDKQWYTKYYTENKRLSNTNLTKLWGQSQLFRKDMKFLLHMWYPRVTLVSNLVIPEAHPAR